MAEKILKRFTATDERGTEYEIVEYVMTVTTTQLSDSHVATEQSQPHYRLANGDAVISTGEGNWQVVMSGLKLRTV